MLEKQVSRGSSQIRLIWCYYLRLTYIIIVVSSVVEQSAVNRIDVGSNPIPRATNVKFLTEKLNSIF